MKHIIRIIMALAALALPQMAQGLDASHYAAESRLATGRWARVRVQTTGMQFISNAQLRTLGFTDPSRVNVYGYGGRQISNILDASQPDDLPMQPVVRTAAGIVFYGVSTVKWNAAASDHPMTYSHTQNLFSDASYYMLSDREAESVPAVTDDRRTDLQPSVTSFTEHLLHERDLFLPSTFSGVALGEDFRSATAQAFSFSLEGIKAGTDAKVLVNFAARTTNGSSSVLVTANGNRLPASSVNTIGAVTNSEMFMRSAKITNTVKDPGDKLSLEIKYTQGGAIFLARLDYIEVNYERNLALAGAPLAFHAVVSDAASVFGIDGCSSSTHIWDVTDPAVPVEVQYTLSGTQARFLAGGTGYREYVAFDPENVKLSPAAAGTVANQNLHAEPVPDMVIITPQAYKTQAERVAALHRDDDSMRVLVVTPEQLYNEFSSGTPDISALRKGLKMWYDRGASDGSELKYCLLMGRPSNDPRGLMGMSGKIPTVPIYFDTKGLSGSSAFSTDDFIGFLSDSRGGNFSIGSEKLGVAIGRMPVTSADEAKTAVDKLIAYSRTKDLAAWRNNVMIIADDNDNGVHLDQAQTVYSSLRNPSGSGANFLYERLYLDTYELKSSGSGLVYPDATARLLEAFDDGILFLDYIGHANPRSWGHEHLLTFTDLQALTNRSLPVILAATCEFARWDDDIISGAELMWLNPKGGAIAFISASRTVYISMNGTLNKCITGHVFGRDELGRANRLGDAYRLGKNDVSGNDENKLRYLLMGDPAMRMFNPDMRVEATQLAGVDLTDEDAAFPQLPARGKINISGRVTDISGTTVSDFQGDVTITLFDAEEVITTKGNGENGVVTHYNDRKNKLLTTRAAVTNGLWGTTLYLPPEISNNYSPALLNFYASDLSGREANGYTENFYVFGWNGDVTDEEGPLIEMFTLNTPQFVSGGIVSPAPIVKASLSDESGINLSNFGIGHKLTLTLDGLTVYDDVANYFTPDPENSGAGTIAYPLTDIEPGDHTLRLTAWDNVNNSSSAELQFRVAVNAVPTLYDVNPDVNPASTSVTFAIAHDWPEDGTRCTVEVFTLGGKKVWSGSTGEDGRITWNLHDGAGARVDRGIYLYRATVKSAKGTSTTKTKKLAVTAP